MTIAEAERLIGDWKSLQGILIGRMGEASDAVKAKDREQPKDAETAHYDRYEEGVQDGFESFLRVLASFSLEDLQRTIGRDES